VTDLLVRFGTFDAVGGISFSLNAGDLLGLIGPNGAGKTTMLRAIAGLQPATAGRVDIMGTRLDRWDGESMRHVGFTPDTPPVYEQLTVRQFLRFIAHGYGIERVEADERIDFWLEKVWLTEKGDAKINTLSRGMRQRIGIARTLLPNPHVILLDEPAAGLDPAGRVQFRELLVDLRRQAKVLIVSSHILADMGEYCSHIGIVSHGKLLRFGTVREVAQLGDSLRTTYRFKLATPVADLQRRLDQIGGIEGVESADHTVTLRYDAGPEAASLLLRELIRHELAITQFGEVEASLERAYLETGVKQVD
jgi:ABC-2 type transport system ATP-binding protein